GLIELGKSIDMEVRVHLQRGRRAKNLALLVSKEPHCLQQIIDDVRHEKIHGKIVAVLANHPDLEPLARETGLPFAWKPADDCEAHFQWLLQQLTAANVDLVVLARYMRILPQAIIKAFSNRVINIYPSLLP